MIISQGVFDCFLYAYAPRALCATPDACLIVRTKFKLVAN